MRTSGPKGSLRFGPFGSSLTVFEFCGEGLVGFVFVVFVVVVVVVVVVAVVVAVAKVRIKRREGEGYGAKLRPSRIMTGAQVQRSFKGLS